MQETPVPVLISKIAAVTALAPSLEETWSRLCAGESAVRPVLRFSTEQLYCHSAAWMEQEDLPPHENAVCRMTASALDQIGHVPKDTILIWTGIKGSAQAVENGTASETSGAIHRPEQYRRWASGRLGLNTEGYEVNAACVAFTAGVILAAQLISNGIQNNVLVCGADAVNRFTFAGFAALRAVSSTRCMPFDRNRDGLAIGEGAAAMLLCSSSSVSENALPRLAQVTGWGSANDAAHITSPARDGSGLSLAMSKAIQKSGLDRDEVEAVCGHGTGTLYSDAMELAALENVFGRRKFPLFSVKGSLGHTLGAAGGIESAIAVLALLKKSIPPTVGLHQPETNAEGRVSATSQAFAGNTILKTSSGFGGCNCAVIYQNV